MPAPSRRRRVRLTRERILTTALALADRDGLEALTMRALGQALGVEAMSLYHHVSGKADLLVGIGDLVLGMIEYPSADGDWRKAMRQAARSTWTVTSAHPNVVPLLLGSPSDTPGSLALAERVLAQMVPAGFAPAEAHFVFRLLQSYVLGSVLMAQRSPSYSDVRNMVATLRASGEFPLLQRALVETRRIDARADFEAGIELIINAVSPGRR
jgi:AcrR family transcriptional regulator